MTELDLSTCSAEELEQALAKKRKAAEKKRADEKQAYEAVRDNLIELFHKEALEVHAKIADMKEGLHKSMDEMHTKLQNYGSLRSNSKGGFKLTHTKGDKAIVRTRATMPQWDERSAKAIELIEDFLGDCIKKSNKKVYEVLMSFLVKNKAGQLEYAKVMDLLQHESKWKDPRWVEGLHLLKESHTTLFRSYGYEFKQLNEKTGEWEHITLNFSSI